MKGDNSKKNILIISPNRVFADYISNVLPELGEEEISEIGIETLARHILGHDIKFQDFFEQVSRLMEHASNGLADRIREKSTLAFLEKIDEYVRHLEQTQFRPIDMTVNGLPVPSWFIAEGFAKHGNLPATRRLAAIAEDIEYNVFIHYVYEATSADRRAIARTLKGMFEMKPLRAAYQEFYTWLGKPGLFRPGKDGVLEYSDIFPLAYLKIRLEGTEKIYDYVKHLLIDEMQDYTPVQYAVIARLFPCRKTILGDMNQSVNPGSSDAETIQKVFPGSSRLQLLKSYRSTYEIIQFTQRIAPNAQLVPVERHGEEPRLAGFSSREDETTEIIRLVKEFQSSGHQTLGIICKSGAQAEELHREIFARGQTAHLLTPRTVEFHQGVTICTAHLAKGLEFDHVIVPDVSEYNYATPLDRSMLYVACTRAMHRLILTFTGQPSPFIQ
jgi:DNA helicase-2/ATP-dependent DNA helicase PcrA